jgi:SulP family sulfate permease
MSEAAEVGGMDDESFATADGDRVICRLRGPWFFGAAARLGSVLDRIADRPREFVVDLTDVPMIDSSGARSFLLLARKMARRGGVLTVVGARPGVRQVLEGQGLVEPAARFLPDLAALDGAA